MLSDISNYNTKEERYSCSPQRDNVNFPENARVHKQAIPSLLQRPPNWSGSAVVDGQIRDISLRDFRGKYLVFFFYPYDFTFVCPTELLQFSDRIEEFQSLDCEVVAASTDSPYTHFVWITTPRKQGGLGGLRIAVLSDKSHKVSRDYGVLDESSGTALKALFVIDDKQILRHITINDFSTARSVDEVLRVVQACQFVDTHGDVCPAGPEAQERPTIVDANTCRDYFSSV